MLYTANITKAANKAMERLKQDVPDPTPEQLIAAALKAAFENLAYQLEYDQITDS